MNDLKERVEELLAEISKTHRYSMSRIYGLYNEVFSTNETPQSCASCLIRKTEQLRAWVAKQEIEEPKANEVIPEKKTKSKKK